VYLACDLNFIVKDEGLLKVTGTHVHWKSGNRPISGTVLRTDFVTTGHEQEVILVYDLSATVMTLSVLEGHSRIASLFKYDISYLWHVVCSLCTCRAFRKFLFP